MSSALILGRAVLFCISVIHDDSCGGQWFNSQESHYHLSFFDFLTAARQTARRGLLCIFPRFALLYPICILEVVGTLCCTEVAPRKGYNHNLLLCHFLLLIQHHVISIRRRLPHCCCSIARWVNAVNCISGVRVVRAQVSHSYGVLQVAGQNSRYWCRKQAGWNSNSGVCYKWYTQKSNTAV